MFPWVYGFQWSAGYLIFLGLFFLVACTVAATLAVVLAKSVLDQRRGWSEFIGWLSEFQDLPTTTSYRQKEL